MNHSERHWQAAEAGRAFDARMGCQRLSEKMTGAYRSIAHREGCSIEKGMAIALYGREAADRVFA